MWIRSGTFLAATAGLLAGCHMLPGKGHGRPDTEVPASEFPAATRPVSTIRSSRWSTEAERDRVSEAGSAMDLAEVKPGMTVADIGAGEGYYTVRLSARVGETGRVLAQDVIPAVRTKLAERVYREKLDNVSVKLGDPGDPKLPANSFDRIFMMHMYHEITAPYEFLWKTRPALRADGEIVVVDVDRPTNDHGIPPSLLECELKAVGFRKVEMHPMPQKGVYMMEFKLDGARPAPDQIKACKA